MPCDRSFSSVICKRLHDTILWTNLIPITFVFKKETNKSIRTLCIGNWRVQSNLYFSKRLHDAALYGLIDCNQASDHLLCLKFNPIGSGNDSYIFDKQFIYLWWMIHISFNFRSHRKQRKMYIHFREKVPANEKRSTCKFSLK